MTFNCPKYILNKQHFFLRYDLFCCRFGVGYMAYDNLTRLSNNAPE